MREGEPRTIIDYYSPGKTKYRSAPEVEKVLRERGMHLCFDNDENQPEQVSSSESDGYHPTESDLEKNTSLPSTSKVIKNPQEVEERLRVCESTQICKFVEDIHKTSRCSTRNVMVCYGFVLFFFFVCKKFFSICFVFGFSELFSNNMFPDYHTCPKLT